MLWQIISTLFCISTFFVSCESLKPGTVQSGLDRVSEFNELFRSKRLGIITNHTAYDRKERHIIDVFSDQKGITISAVFGPEHGIRGTEAAGRSISDTTAGRDNIPVYSLYGKNKKPTAEMLKNVDVLIYDIQDIGTRYYTYISTMCLAMEAAAESDILFVVLDRPNPLNGMTVEGNCLDTSFSSFVGMYPIPVRHGMTSGEIALMVNGEGWLADGLSARLRVVAMSGWDRRMWYDETGLIWRPTSPNIPDLHVAAVYPGTCLFEGTNISEGRGTYQPFLRVGAPWLLPGQLDIVQKMIDLPGILIRPISFTPKSIPQMAPHPKYVDQEIIGVSLQVTNRNQFRPYLTGITLIKLIHDLNPEQFEWRRKHFDRLCGTDQIRKMITGRTSLDTIEKWIDRDIEAFEKRRSKYLLY